MTTFIVPCFYYIKPKIISKFSNMKNSENIESDSFSIISQETEANEEENYLSKIIKIQNNFRFFRFWKNLKKKILENYKNSLDNEISIVRIGEINFQSLINKNIKKISKEIIEIDNLKHYNFDNYMETFSNLNFNEKKMFENLKKKTIPLHPIAICNENNPVDKEFYWGSWDPKGKKEGFGIQIFSSSAFYFGTFKANKMHGIGIYLFKNKRKELSLNLEDKKSEFKLNFSYSKSFKKFDNNFLQNMNNEENEYFLYIGEFEENNFHGYGELFQMDDNYFVGEFKNNMITEEGSYYLK